MTSTGDNHQTIGLGYIVVDYGYLGHCCYSSTQLSGPLHPCPVQSLRVKAQLHTDYRDLPLPIATVWYIQYSEPPHSETQTKTQRRPRTQGPQRHFKDWPFSSSSFLSITLSNNQSINHSTIYLFLISVAPLNSEFTPRFSTTTVHDISQPWDSTSH